MSHNNLNLSKQNKRKGVNVHTEIAPLKTVLVHRPGQEVENLVPDLLERLLFDDIPYLKLARQEHDFFVQKMLDNGVEVLYIEKLLTETLTANDQLNKDFIEQFLSESNAHTHHLKKLRAYYSNLPIKEMIDVMIAGVETLTIGVKNADGYPFAVDPLPNLLFQRDVFSSVYNGVCLNRMRSTTRNRETLFAFFVLSYHPRFSEQVKWYYERHWSSSIEGGDVLMLNAKNIIVGCTERTEMKAIEKLASNLFNDLSHKDFRVVALDIPKKRAFMHLDTVLTNIDYDKFVVHPLIFEYENQFKIWEITKSGKKLIKMSLIDYFSFILGFKVTFIRCGGDSPIAAGREQWNDGTNVLTLKPGKVISYERNHVTNQLLRDAGIEVIEMPSSELSRGRGGPRCMTMPIWRDIIPATKIIDPKKGDKS